MELTILERLISLGLLPEVGDILRMRIRAQMTDKLGLTIEEIEKYGVVQEGTSVQWRTDLPQEREIPLEPLEIGILRDGLKKLNEEEKLTPQHITLYEKIVE